MAGEWIKFDKATLDKPELFEMARELEISTAEVLMAALRFWCWLDTQASDGSMTHVASHQIDAIAQCERFSHALEAVGWLQIDAEKRRITIPHFEYHNGKTAKRRALTKRRMVTHRALHARDARVTRVASPEKRRSSSLSIPPVYRENSAPNGVQQATWDDWVKRKGKSQTAAADRMQREQLAEWQAAGHDPNAIVRDAIAGGWKGLHAPNGSNGARPLDPLVRARMARTEDRAQTLDILTGRRPRDEHVIEGAVEREDDPDPFLPAASGVRQSG